MNVYTAIDAARENERVLRDQGQPALEVAVTVAQANYWRGRWEALQDVVNGRISMPDTSYSLRPIDSLFEREPDDD